MIEENLQYRLAHIGIRVINLEESMNWYETNFGFKRGEVRDKPQLGLRLAAMRLGDSELELLCPYAASEEKLMERKNLPELLRTIGINHIAISVNDVNKSYNALRNNNIALITELIDSRVFFCMDSANNILIEVRQG